MAAATTPPPGINRREFLYYIWAASIALYTTEFTALIVWFLIPRIRAGEFGGLFPLPGTDIPSPNEPPKNYSDGRFWLVNLDSANPNNLMYSVSDEPDPIVGVVALYKVCTHLGCIYPWNSESERFECPCHGSKYRLDGRRIESPAPRTLDRFKLTLEYTDGTTSTSEPDEYHEWGAVVLEPGKTVAQVIVDTGDRKDGPAMPLLSELVA